MQAIAAPKFLYHPIWLERHLVYLDKLHHNGECMNLDPCHLLNEFPLTRHECYLILDYWKMYRRVRKASE